jgi:hypothetical protein
VILECGLDKLKMRCALLLPSLLLLLSFNVDLQAQLWSGVLDPSRAIDWTKAGVTGGIVSSTSQCGSTIPAGSSAATINSAIQGCGPQQYVLLAPGTYNLSTGIVMKSGVTLRGAGPDQTFLVFSGADPCGGWFADICVKDSLGQFFGSASVQPGNAHAATWSGGYSAGSTNITLTNAGSPISVGQYIYLDQANDTSDNGGFLVCDTQNTGCSLEGGAPGRTINSIQRNQIQIVKVTSVSRSSYGITPGVYGLNWSNGKSPAAWWSAMITGVGIENLSLDHTNSTGKSGITFFNAFDCWVKNVRSLKANRNHVWLTQAAHITVRDSYFYGTQKAMSQSYGVESFIASDNLVENNIFQHITSPIMMGPSMGAVFAYNFSIDDYYYVAAWLIQSVFGGHDAGVLYNLFEGNQGSGFMGDVFHGTSNANTIFRNRFTGWENGKTEDTIPVQLYSYNRYMNIVGNVLGTFGYHSSYQTALGTGASKGIYDLTSGNSENTVIVPSDPMVASTLMRWGNYDVVTGSVRWNGTEVPSSLSQYATAVPSSHSLPASFYLAVQPTWWPSGKAWPPIGPDVNNGNVPNVGGYANTLPAADCYLNVMQGKTDGTSSILTYNASSCYDGLPAPNPPASNPPGPNPPTGVTATAQ